MLEDSTFAQRLVEHLALDLAPLGDVIGTDDDDVSRNA